MAIYKIDDKILDTITRTILIPNNENEIKLSRSELNILVYLMENQGVIVKKDVLISVGWPKKIVVHNSLTVAVSNIRKALNSHDSIISNKGIGYTLSDNLNIVHDIEDEDEDECLISEYDLFQRDNNYENNLTKDKDIFTIDVFIYCALIIIGLYFIIKWEINFVG
ncbi:winged helix-turn-helix domain-containing protein [Photobacterium damselae]|uniref:winged helix-turn-helix domain-containing protein n=1 Tax=Photobacterium damselae TaxID=38293 RepID=UPI000D07E6B0|nr:winged helix-turn-helix domain-containing protein [Photobacterium damselae]PSB84768.1 hypothetical protein C5F62_05530 [Photobacterium damselae subsp. damselae]